MTPKQEERIRTKIKRIKDALAAERRMFGGYFDNSGLRYAPPELYLKLQDYTGALRYFNWFHKNFSDDGAYGIFFFEWTVTLFKTKRLQQAEKKAIETFCSNAYLLDYFLQRDPKLAVQTNVYGEGYEFLVKHFSYTKDQEELVDFAVWLSTTMDGVLFTKITSQYSEIERQLVTERVGPKRSRLIDAQGKLLTDLQ